MLREAIVTAGVEADLQVLPDGETAVEFIDRLDADVDAPCPALVILDLNLPKKTGGEVLGHLRRSRKCRAARVIIVTSSHSERDQAMASELGADGYFRKPSTFDAFMQVGNVIREMLGGGEVDRG